MSINHSARGKFRTMTNTRTLHLCSFSNNTETEREKKVFRDIQLKKGSHHHWGARQTNVLGVLTHDIWCAAKCSQNSVLHAAPSTGKRPRKRSCAPASVMATTREAFSRSAYGLCKEGDLFTDGAVRHQ